MSFATQAQTADSQDSDANNDENDDFAPHPVTSRYLSVQAHLGLLKDAIGAVDSFSMSDTDLPAVKWANAVEDALYTRDGCLGEMQGEMTDYTTDDFKEAYGDSITTDHADLTNEERAELKELFKKSENHERDDAKGQFKLPVVNGDRLPLLVADEDVLSEAKEMLETILDEASDNDASSTTSDVESDEENEFTKAAKAADLDPSVVDATLEGYPVPSAGTVDDLKDTIDVFGINGTQYCPALETLLELEEANKDRKTAKAALKSAIDAFDEESEEEEEEESDDEDAGSTTDDLDKEELAETVAKATTEAVLEALDN